MLQLLGFIIDCPDPMKLAAFYSQVTGCAIMEGSSDNFAGITFGEVDLAFQRVERTCGSKKKFKTCCGSPAAEMR